MQIHKIQNFVQVMFRPIIRKVKTYVRCKYSNFVTSGQIFQALIVSDRLYVKCHNTSCFGWSKSSLLPIFITDELLFLRNYTNFKDVSRTFNELDHFVGMKISGFMENRYVVG